MSELLQQKLRQAELLLAKREALGQKRQEALAEQGNLEPKLDRLLDTTRELQRLVRDRGGLPPNASVPPRLTQPLSCRSRPTSPSATAGGR